MGALEIPRRSTRATPARREPLGPRRAVASEGSVHAQGGFLTCQQGRILNPDGGACGFSLRWRSLSRAAAASLVVSWAHPWVGRGGPSGSQVPRPQRPLLARARRYLRETAGGWNGRAFVLLVSYKMRRTYGRGTRLKVLCPSCRLCSRRFFWKAASLVVWLSRS